MKNLIIALSVLLFLIIINESCSLSKHNSNLIVFEQEDSLKLKIQNTAYSNLWKAQFSEKDNCFITLTGSNYKSNPVLYRYDANSGNFIDSLDFTSLIDVKSSLLSFHYTSRDSVFLFLMKHNAENDSIILLANGRGDLVKPITPKHPFLASQYHPVDSFTLRVDAFLSEPKVSGTKIFFGFYSTGNESYFNPTSLYDSKRPLIGYYDFVKDTTVIHPNILYPKTVDSKFNWGMYNYNFTINEKGNPVLGFGYTPQLLEWDINSNDVIIHQISSFLVDTIKPEQNVLRKQFSLDEPFFSKISYHQDIQGYSRKIIFPKESFGNFNNIFIYSDESFNYIGEQYNNNLNAIVNSHWYFDFLQDNSKGYFTFYKTKFNRQELDTTEVIKDMRAYQQQKEEKIEKAKCSIGIGLKEGSEYKPENLVKYASKRLNIEDSTYTLICVQDKSCRGCVEYILKFFSINQNVLGKQNFYLLYVGDNFNLTEYELKTYNLADYSNLRQDSTYFYNIVHPQVSNNPRLLFVDELEVKMDSIYPPDNMQNLILKGMELQNLKGQ